MYDQIYSQWTEDKNKKKDFKVLSFVNHVTLDILKGYEADILRFDLNEFAALYGYSHPQEIIGKEIIPLLRKITKIPDEKKLNNLIAVDLPLQEILEGKSYSLNNIIDFYHKSSADLLVVDIHYVIHDMINLLSQLKVPVVLNVRGNSKEKDYEKLYNKVLESESMGIVMVIIEDMEHHFINKLKPALQIPVICNNSKAKSDGFYAQFSSIFGLLDKEDKQYLNLRDLIYDGMNDCLNDLK